MFSLLDSAPIDASFSAALVFFGGLFAISSTELKELIAFSGLSHTGFVLLANDSLGDMYLKIYFCSLAVLLIVFLNVKFTSGYELVFISDLRHLMQPVSEIYAAVVIVAFSVLSGLPPFTTFFLKLLILFEVLDEVGFFRLVFSNIFAIAYNLWVVVVVCFDTPYNVRALVVHRSLFIDFVLCALLCFVCAYGFVLTVTV